MIGVTYNTPDGKDRRFALETADDTNLMVGAKKSAFTLFRSHYLDEDGETRYEYWARLPKQSSYDYYVYWEYFFHQMVVNGKSYEGVYSDDMKITRPNARPEKIVFDSNRTSLSVFLNGYELGLYPFPGHLAYVGSEAEHPTGNFELYGYLMTTGRNYYGYGNALHCSFFPRNDDFLKTLTANWMGVTSDKVSMLFSGKVAEVRDWEIVSNDTPEENTYYVVVENKKGDIVDVITTHGFGQTVNVGGKDYVVKYDMVIRPGR